MLVILVSHGLKRSVGLCLYYGTNIMFCIISSAEMRLGMMAIIMAIGKGIVKVIGFGIVIWAISDSIMLLSNAASYFDAKGSELRVKARTQYTSELIAQILTMVDFEIDHFITQSNNMGKTIELTGVYNQINRISVEIYDGVERDFAENKFLFNEDYLMKFIINAVNKRMIERCVEHNEELKG